MWSHIRTVDRCSNLKLPPGWASFSACHVHGRVQGLVNKYVLLIYTIELLKHLAEALVKLLLLHR